MRGQKTNRRKLEEASAKGWVAVIVEQHLICKHVVHSLNDNVYLIILHEFFIYLVGSNMSICRYERVKINMSSHLDVSAPQMRSTSPSH